tara:strand:- start:1155 stop:4313 length:3159 start_codon:yes stop_codon:yes gene_type:complete
MNNKNKRSIFSTGLISKRNSSTSSLRKGRLAGLALGLFSLISAQAFAQLKCEHVISNQWNTGFSATLEITNEGTETVNDWQSITWEYTDGSTKRSGSSVDFSGSNPYTAKPKSWNKALAPGATFSFGIQGNKATPANAVSPLVTGPLCKAPVIPNVGAQWTLNAAESALHFVSVKKLHTAENQTFNTLSGSIDVDGKAVFAIDLNSIDTANGTRDERIRNELFETHILPNAYFSVDVDTVNVDNMAVGTTQLMSLPGTLSLHGINLALTADVIVIKLSDEKVNVSTVKPIIIDSEKLDMNGGIEWLRLAASLSSIGERVPVYLSLTLDANNDPDVPAIALADKPASPLNLAAFYDMDLSKVGLSWDRPSDNESGFIVRRKNPAGFWQTAATLGSSFSTLGDPIGESGLYKYKVIAYSNEIASDATNQVEVEVGVINPVVIGLNLYQENCVACHGVGGTGGFAPDLNTARDEAGFANMLAYIESNMPLGNAGDCDADCAENIGAYIETLWPEDLACDAPVQYGARQLKLLTQVEYQSSVEDLFGIDSDLSDGLNTDSKIGFFFNNVLTPVSSSAYDKYLTVGAKVAQVSANNDFASILNCASYDQSCSEAFVSDVMPEVFRRPLTSEEIATYSFLSNGSTTAGDVKLGIQLAIESALSSPQFLYRHELGESSDSAGIDADAFELTPYEMATYLSYSFAGTTPDQTLLTKAANNQLDTEEQIVAEVSRLLDTPQGKKRMGDYVGAWLGTDDLEKSLKDQSVWPGFDQVVPHMEQEIREFFASVMLDPSERFASLYTANHTYVNEPLAQHYGISGVVGDEFQRVETNDRGGVLRNGAFMARWAENVETAPFRRAAKVRRRMLCQPMPAPPAGVDDERQGLLELHEEFIAAETTTNREKYEVLTSTGTCVACHQELMTPLAMGMEDYDSVGNLRTEDLNGNLINAIGTLYAPNNLEDKHISLAFDGTTGLSDLLAGSTTAQSCVPETLFRYTLGVGVDGFDVYDPNSPQLNLLEQEGYACEVEDLTQTMMNESPRKMLEKLGVMQSVRYRKEWLRQ